MLPQTVFRNHPWFHPLPTTHIQLNFKNCLFLLLINFKFSSSTPNGTILVQITTSLLISAAIPEQSPNARPTYPPTHSHIRAMLFWIDVHLIQPIAHLQVFGAVQCLQHRPSTTWPAYLSRLSDHLWPSSPTGSPIPVNSKLSLHLIICSSQHIQFLFSLFLSLCICNFFIWLTSFVFHESAEILPSV